MQKYLMSQRYVTIQKLLLQLQVFIVHRSEILSEVQATMHFCTQDICLMSKSLQVTNSLPQVGAQQMLHV